eukprot:gene14895-biopygen4933
MASAGASQRVCPAPGCAGRGVAPRGARSPTYGPEEGGAPTYGGVAPPRSRSWRLLARDPPLAKRDPSYDARVRRNLVAYMKHMIDLAVHTCVTISRKKADHLPEDDA